MVIWPVFYWLNLVKPSSLLTANVDKEVIQGGCLLGRSVEKESLCPGLRVDGRWRKGRDAQNLNKPYDFENDLTLWRPGPHRHLKDVCYKDSWVCSWLSPLSVVAKPSDVSVFMEVGAMSPQTPLGPAHSGPWSPYTIWAPSFLFFKKAGVAPHGTLLSVMWQPGGEGSLGVYV